MRASRLHAFGLPSVCCEIAPPRSTHALRILTHVVVCSRFLKYFYIHLSTFVGKLHFLIFVRVSYQGLLALQSSYLTNDELASKSDCGAYSGKIQDEDNQKRSNTRFSVLRLIAARGIQANIYYSFTDKCRLYYFNDTMNTFFCLFMKQIICPSHMPTVGLAGKLKQDCNSKVVNLRF